MYKKIGILGGMGPEATADLYLRIIQIFQREYGAVYDSDFPEIVILNLPIPDVVESTDDEDKVREMLVDGLKRLVNIGSDFIVVPCNTVMCYIDELRKVVNVPLVNVIQETSNEIFDCGFKIVGLLGTESTIRNNLYGKILGDVKVLTLGESEQRETTRIIMNILSGIKSDEAILLGFVKKLKKMGAEKVILGCTELPLVVKSDDVIDTLEILARSAVKMAVS